MDPIVIATLMISSVVLASAGAKGALTLVLHLMSRSTLQPAPIVDSATR